VPNIHITKIKGKSSHIGVGIRRKTYEKIKAISDRAFEMGYRVSIGSIINDILEDMDLEEIETCIMEAINQHEQEEQENH